MKSVPLLFSPLLLLAACEPSPESGITEGASDDVRTTDANGTPLPPSSEPTQGGPAGSGGNSNVGPSSSGGGSNGSGAANGSGGADASSGGANTSGGTTSSGGVGGGTGGTTGSGGSHNSSGGSGPQVECGNGSQEQGEACDGSDLAGKGCSDLGFTGGQLSCSGSCEFNTSECTEGGSLVTEVRTFCSDTCWKEDYRNDGRCWDGGPKANFNTCDFGTDCSDCGPQELEVPVVSGGGRAACGQTSFGTSAGDPAEDWTTYNQHGAAVSLSDFCGKWVYIELGAMWCPVCRNHAVDLEEMANELGSYKDGLVVIQAHGENLNPIKPNPTETPSVAELLEFANEFNQKDVHAICDADYEIWGRYWPLEETSNPPRGILINPDGVIDRIGQHQKSSVQRKMDRW